MSAERPLLVYLELTDEESGDEYRWDAEAADGETYFITYKRGVFCVGSDDQKELLIDRVITDGSVLSVQREELMALLDGTFDVSALNHPNHYS